MLTAYLLVSYRLALRDTAVDEQFRSRNVAAMQQPLNNGVRIGEVILKYGDVRSIAEHRPIGALQRRILVIVQNSDLVLLHWYPSRSCKRLSDCEDDLAEGAALNEVAQSICRLSQRERLCHDGLDRTGLKEWKNDPPCGSPYLRR